MNIQTATIYAKQGYKLYRRECWVNDVDGIVKSIYIDGGNWMYDAAHYAILEPEDCLADDWQIVRE